MPTWLRCSSTLEVDCVPYERSWVDNISFKTHLYCAQTVPWKQQSNQKPTWQVILLIVQFVTENIGSLRGSSRYQTVIQISMKYQLTRYVVWQRVVWLFKCMSGRNCWTSPYLRSSSSITEEWDSCSPILIKQTTTLSTNWKNSQIWQKRLEDVKRKVPAHL